MTERDWTKILGWPGYRVYRHEINEQAKTLKLWVRRKRGNQKLVCSGCGRRVDDVHEVYEREVRDLPCFEFRTTVVIELYRLRCPDCGIKAEKVPQLPSKAPFSKRFEDAVGLACESAPARRVARQFGLAESTVRAIDLRCLERWDAARRKPALRQMGVDEIHLGKKQKFLTVVCNLETGEPLWFGRERKKETLDGYFRTELSRRQRRGIDAACVDMWEPYQLSIQEWAPNCQIVYDKFHVMQHANAAVDEVRRAEFFRKGGRMRGLVKGKRWLLLTRWVNLTSRKRQELNALFALNRRLLKAYLLKESLDRLWEYRYEGAMLRYLQNWIDQLRWQRLRPFQKLAQMLLDHVEGILNYCRTKVPLGVVEAVNGNIKALLRRGRGYKNIRYLLLKAQRMAVTKTEFLVLQKAAQNGQPVGFLRRAPLRWGGRLRRCRLLHQNELADSGDSSIMDSASLSRRRWLAGASASAALSLLPRRAGATRLPGANDRIRVGVIGLGPRGNLLVDQLPEQAEIVAVSDCHLKRCEEAAAKRQARWDIVQDYRRLLDRKDIDGVIIATHDFGRALCCIHACQAGKDVYAEKPLTLYVEEGRAMVKAAQRYNRVFQVGTQQRSMAMNQLGAKFVREGGLGKLLFVQGVNYPGPAQFPGMPEEPVPAGLDWNTWLNQTEFRPYNANLHGRWSRYRDYSGGEVTNWGAHGLDQIQFALGTDRTGPVEFWPLPESGAGAVAYRYANGVTVRLEMPPGDLQGGAIFVGEKGRMELIRNNFRTDPPRMVKELPPPEEVQKWRDDVALWQAKYHMGNWLDCMRSRATPLADAEIGHRSVSICHLVGITRELNRRLRWDPEAERFNGDEQANGLLRRARRKGFELPAV